MSSGLTGKNIMIALVLAIGFGIVGSIVGYKIGHTWLGYTGSLFAVLYLIWAYTKAQQDDEAAEAKPAGVSRRRRG